MPVAMKFGRYNRHPHSLIYIGSDGSFNVNRISASRLQLTTPIIESVDVETALNESVKRLVGVPPLKIPALDKAFYVSAEVEKMKMKGKKEM